MHSNKQNVNLLNIRNLSLDLAFSFKSPLKSAKAKGTVPSTVFHFLSQYKHARLGALARPSMSAAFVEGWKINVRLTDCNGSRPIASKREDGALKATPAANTVPPVWLPPAECFGSRRFPPCPHLQQISSYQTPHNKMWDSLMDLYYNGDVKTD